LATRTQKDSGCYPINGFLTPPVGVVNAKVGVVAHEGNPGFTDDSVSLDGVALSDSLNPSNNLFNSTISHLRHGNSAGCA
jgi:hypothetical protein